MKSAEQLRKQGEQFEAEQDAYDAEAAYNQFIKDMLMEPLKYENRMMLCEVCNCFYDASEGECCMERYYKL